MSGDSEQTLEEEQCLVRIAEDLYGTLELTAEEHGTTVELIVNALLKGLLETKTTEELMEIAMEGEG